MLYGIYAYILYILFARNISVSINERRVYDTRDASFSVLWWISKKQGYP